MLRYIGKGRWPGNPAYCSGCFRDLYRYRVGAEIECTSFFADVRGSTALAEKIGPTEFRGLLDRFYEKIRDVSTMERTPAMEGRMLSLIVTPGVKRERVTSARSDDRDDAPAAAQAEEQPQAEAAVGNA